MHKSAVSLGFVLFVVSLFLTGCSRFAAGAPEPTATSTFVPVPTFTPTSQAVDSVGVSAAEDVNVTVVPPPASNTPAASLNNLLPTPTPTIELDGDAGFTTGGEIEAEPTAGNEPRLTVSGEFVNVREGPSVSYSIVGAATAGDGFPITGRNETGDWWQICCFDEQPGWIFGPLADVENTAAVALAADIPPAPTAAPTAVPLEEAPSATDVPPEEPPAEASAPAADSGTAGVFDPDAQYHIVGYRVIGYGENNGGLFNNGAQHMIFVNVIDEAGAGIDGAVVKNAINDNLEIVTGSKGPGRAEFEMFWDPYKLYVASDPSGPVTSQISNQMNTAYPHIPDIVGRLGPPEEEYAICPTVDDRCEPPFFHAHWSYEITFQKVN